MVSDVIASPTAQQDKAKRQYLLASQVSRICLLGYFAVLHTMCVCGTYPTNKIQLQLLSVFLVRKFRKLLTFLNEKENAKKILFCENF